MKRFREAHGWSQIELADKSGLHRTYVGDLERSARNITIDNLGRLARGLGVDPRELFTPPDQ